jgi:hypothetical protein
MKPQRFNSKKDIPSVKGNLTVEEIVRTDWERNFKQAGYSLDDARRAIKSHVDNGLPIYRLRNTLFLITPQDDFETVEFHTVTADTREVYVPMLVMFMSALHMKQNTEIAFTYVNDKQTYNLAAPMFGQDVDIEESDDRNKGKYKVVIDLDSFVPRMQTTAANRSNAA